MNYQRAGNGSNAAKARRVLRVIINQSRMAEYAKPKPKRRTFLSLEEVKRRLLARSAS